MSDTNNDTLSLDDPDRLPWLETADGFDYEKKTSPLKIAGLVLAGLALIAAIVGTIYWLQRGSAGNGQGNGELIAAQDGPYKEVPTDREGKSFEGEGDAAFAASEGTKTGAVIAPAVPEEAKAEPVVTATAPKTPANAVMVQLGAFNDPRVAAESWTAFGKRFGFLSGANHRIAEAADEGGRKIFRLQAITANATDAQQLCAKLKAAGENCLIVR